MATTAAAISAGVASRAAPPSVPIWDMDAPQLVQWIRTVPGIASNPESPQLLKNLVTAVAHLLKNNPSQEPPAKKLKSEESATPQPLNDPHHIWIGQADDQELPQTYGAVVVQLTPAGLLNALKGNTTDTDDSIKALAHTLELAVQTRMETDFLETTPKRIHDMMCPEVSEAEFRAIRKRVYDTVVLGKGMNHADLDEDDQPVAARAAIHQVEKFKKCRVCDNNDQSLFVLDAKNGDVICTNCGTVAMESIMHEGSQFRKFEGEIDRNHHGDASNPLYSNAHNMSTTLSGMQVTSSVNQGFGTRSKGLETVLRNAHAYTELNISQFGKGERKTRIGYKDRQKRSAFSQMTHIGDALNLHEAVVQRAKELFSGFRDDRELVQQFKGVVAACLCEAFDQLSRDGKRILKLRNGEVASNSVRANRRNELHHANMAGKGGLMLNVSTTAEPKEEPTGTTTSPQAALAIERKPAPTWDLDDCRSWLLEASRNIAQQWIKDRNNGVKGIPEGSQDELEGNLVEHTINLCNQLEEELKSRESKAAGVAGNKVVTPRVQDMAQLSIKWQHAHERGSGGKGGVGHSGHQTKPSKQGRTAGQILILKTGKKLGVMLNDPVAGNAFHKELRALAARQEARKRKQVSDEASRQRFQQMKRKPWLVARAEADNSNNNNS